MRLPARDGGTSRARAARRPAAARDRRERARRAPAHAPPPPPAAAPPAPATRTATEPWETARCADLASATQKAPRENRWRRCRLGARGYSRERSARAATECGESSSFRDLRRVMEETFAQTGRALG